MTALEILHSAYRDHEQADRVWSAELTKAFRRDACNQRYFPAGKGEPGTLLRAAYDEFARTAQIWHSTPRP